MYIILAYILSGIILNNQVVSVLAAELNFTEPESYESEYCPSYTGINCYCYYIIECKVNDELGDLYVSLDSKGHQLLVVCPKDTKLSINLLHNSSYLEELNCNNIYTENNNEQQVIDINEANKLTLIYNSRIAVADIELRFQNLLQLQIIVKSTEDIDFTPFEFDFIDSETKVLPLYVQSTMNKRDLTREYFRNFTEIRRLDLVGSNMPVLDANLFEPLTQLNCLNLSSNKISQLPPKLFAKQRKLIILDLSCNLLTHLPPELFKETVFLWQLKLNGNRLHHTENLMATLRPLHYLHWLDLNMNKLQNIFWGRLSTNFNDDIPLDLEQYLDHNSMLQLKNYTGNQKLNLKVIDLRHNRLYEFDMERFSKVGIKRDFILNLAHNSIKSIYTLKNLPNTTDDLSEIKMTGNPIVCDCSLAWIYNSNYRALFPDLQCKQTSNELLMDVAQLRRDELCAWQPIFCPTNCDCYTQSDLLTINCNGRHLDVIDKLPRPEQVNRTSSILDTSVNQLTVLPPNTTFGYANVTQLNASYNRITNVSIFQLPTNLTILDLRSNRLKTLSADLLRGLLNDSDKLQSLYLSENAWRCDCAEQHLLYTVRAQRLRIPDVELLHCDNLKNVTLLTANVDDLCQAVERSPYLTASIITTALVIIISLLLVALFYKYNLEVKVWLHAHNILTCCIHESELDKNKKFDAFISYAHQDAHFVNHTLLPRLEECEDPPFLICTHERNWLPGAYIPEQIIESVDQSRRTIIVLSQHFIESDWARMEFRTAHQNSLNESRTRLILVKYGEITNSELLDKELRAYLQMNTYLDCEDPRFWEKLRYAMPHKSADRERNTDMLEVNGRMYVMGQEEKLGQTVDSSVYNTFVFL
ncbi:protein toll-like isoform X2 [Zeugodacus cucurbitae]|uniref:protein toll-like isoform X2 n=1 Tax=Zeugodacus cucurbitae TaxID=28588 RepID=UPI0023D8E98E|nr:protein toll-like isoform X2 [Zeugodacus cucurbitae]